MAELRRTPLYDLHLSLGARMVPFAGWEMPVQYPTGVLTEHRHTRADAGLFDVSHMGQIILRGENAAAALETLVPADIVGLLQLRADAAADQPVGTRDEEAHAEDSRRG